MSDAPRSALDAPSQHPIPADVPAPESWRLRVEGLVARPLSLSLADLREMAAASHQGSFTCERGWEAGDARWSGPSLASVLALAQPLPAATAIYADAPGFRSVVPLGSAARALLAIAVDGQPLNEARGAPCRLVVTDPDCQLSMKWLERLELFTRAPDQPAGPRKPPEG
jgi:DMSO/TMAO reductase YedYZ molybdopterin-dependent catalytic subunit